MQDLIYIEDNDENLITFATTKPPKKRNVESFKYSADISFADAIPNCFFKFFI